MSWFESFKLTFIPLFIVIDCLGAASVVVSIIGDVDDKEHHSIINAATITATAIGFAFLFFGQFILKVMGIKVGAFAVGGGIVLIVLSIKQMITGQMVDVLAKREVAIVPIGTPLIVGPATITTLLILVTHYSLLMVLFSFVLNMLITWVIFLLGEKIVKLLGHNVLNVVSRIFSLLLAAIAVNMVIEGLRLEGILATIG